MDAHSAPPRFKTGPESFILDFISKANGCNDPSALLDLMQKCVDELGFQRWAYQASPSAKGRDPIIIHNYPQQWVDHYVAESFSAVDPVIVLGSTRTTPFLWSSLLRGRDVSAPQKRFNDEARDSGLIDGVGVPIHAPGRTAMFSIASDAGEGEIRKRLSRFGPHLVALGFCFHVMASELVERLEREKPGTNPLSARERECLSWSVEGKTAWEIAEILRISERTVRFHLNNAKAKLGVASHRAAALKAVREGHIDP
jgi:DNA-binding CsgD family transcriptional regulator